jgi:hypothetical protein
LIPEADFFVVLIFSLLSYFSQCTLSSNSSVRGAPPKPRGKLDCGLIRRAGTNRFVMVPRRGTPVRTNYAVITSGQRFPMLDHVWTLPPPTRRDKDGKDGKGGKGKEEPSQQASEQASELTRDVSLLAFRNSTHVRHQVRAACSWLGTPIVGDRDYGGGEVLDAVFYSGKNSTK